MKKKKFKLIVICTLIIVLFVIGVWQIFNYYNYTKKQEYLYNEYNRMSIVLSLTYYKNFDNFVNNLLHQQRYQNTERISKEKLIEDFSNYDYIPILNYIKGHEVTEQVLVDSFGKIMDFLEFVNYYNYHPADTIIVSNKDGFYSQGDIIKVNKKVISKTSFNNLYYNFAGINSKSLEDYFLKKMYSNNSIQQKYNNYYNFKNSFSSNYESFFNDNSTVVQEIISKELDAFSEYLNKKCIIIDKEEYTEEELPYEYKLDLSIEYDKIELEYEFDRVQRIYNDNSEHSKILYKIDLNNIWKILREQEKPIIYM